MSLGLEYDAERATADPYDGAFDTHWPFTRCDHCGHCFLWDDDIARQVQPDADLIEPGQKGCPACRRLTW